MKACFLQPQTFASGQKKAGKSISSFFAFIIVSNKTQFICWSYALRHIFENQEVIFFCFPSPLAFIGLYNEGLLRF